MSQFAIGDWLSGGQVRIVPVLDGSWDVRLNEDDEVTVTVDTGDPDVRALNLGETAAVKQSFLVAFDGDTVHAGGPILGQNWSDDRRLVLKAGGALSYLNSRVLLPDLAGRNPTDPTTDSRFKPADEDPEADYPWPTDTRLSLQGILVTIIDQAVNVPGGEVPIVLPAPLAGAAEQDYRGTDLASVGERVRQLTQVEGGPDLRFDKRWVADRTGVEWVAAVGTPDVPMLFSPIEPSFSVSAAKSSISDLKVKRDGSKIGSQAFVSGGRREDTTLIAVQQDSTLLDAGFALWEQVDSSHATVTIDSTLQGYAAEILLRGRQPWDAWSFSHDTSVHPFPGTFTVGDYCRVTVDHGHPYLAGGVYRHRVMSVGGDAVGKKLRLSLQPVDFTPTPIPDGYGVGYYGVGYYGG